MATIIYTASIVLDTPDNFTQLPPLAASDASRTLPDFATWVAVVASTAVRVLDLPIDGTLNYLGNVVALLPSGDEVLQVSSGKIPVANLTDDAKIQSVIDAIRQSTSSAEGGDA